MTRVRRGMSIEEVRQIWLPRAEAKTEAILNGFYTKRRSSGRGSAREGFGVYGQHQSRAAREKVRLAIKLLEGAGLEVSHATIRKVTRQSYETISSYWDPPRQNSLEEELEQIEAEPIQNIQFPRRQEPMEDRLWEPDGESADDTGVDG